MSSKVKKEGRLVERGWGPGGQIKMKYSDICNADSALQKGTLPQENGGFGGDGGETIEEKLHSESYRCTRKEKSISVVFGGFLSERKKR